MFAKLNKYFEKFSNNTDGRILTKTDFKDFLFYIEDKGVIIEHDIPLLKKYVTEFPFNFQKFCNYIKQIFEYDLEQKFKANIDLAIDSFGHLYTYLNSSSFESLDNLHKLLVKLNKNLKDINKTNLNLKEAKEKLINRKEEIKRLLWIPMNNNKNLLLPLINTNKSKDSISDDLNSTLEATYLRTPSQYQITYKPKIEYEYNIIKTKKVYLDTVNTVGKPRMFYKFEIDKYTCSDRDIPIETWKIPANYYSKDILNLFYYKCEGLRELLLSKYFQKFTGFDDISSNDFHYYFFEYIDGDNLVKLIKSRDLEIIETSMFFLYIAKEILLGLRDLLSKCTYSVSKPITCIDNIYYEISQQRLYFKDLHFDKPKEYIYNSHEMSEAKLLFNYALILIELLSISQPELSKLLDKIKKLQKMNDNLIEVVITYQELYQIEDYLNMYLENETVIAILLECLISPYKYYLRFNRFYKDKNFLKKMPKKDESKPREKENKLIRSQEVDEKDFHITFEKYYDNLEPNNEEEYLELNNLLFHPLFSKLSLDKKFIIFLMKGKNS